MKPNPNSENVQNAWKEEIAKRLEDIQSGRVSTVHAEEAEKMIRTSIENDTLPSSWIVNNDDK